MKQNQQSQPKNKILSKDDLKKIIEKRENKIKSGNIVNK